MLDGKHMTGNEFSHIRHKAKKRNLEFNITQQNIIDIFRKQKGLCALSGIEIRFNLTRSKEHRASDKRLGNASIDRIDSGRGYTIDNIQLVDKHVNFAKQQLSQNDFLELCRKVALFNGLCTIKSI